MTHDEAQVAAPGAGPAGRRGAPRVLDLAGIAGDALWRRPLRSAVVMAATVGVLAPWTLGLALSAGMLGEARAALGSGPDLYVLFDRLGSSAAMPEELAGAIATVPGVARALPRLTGRAVLRGRTVQVVGVDGEDPTLGALISLGRPPRTGASEVVVGGALATSAGLSPGQRVVVSTFQTRLFDVAGVMSATAPLASSEVVLTTLPAAKALFDEEGPTEVLLWTEPGQGRDVASRVRALSPRLRLRDRALWEAIAARGLSLKSGAVITLLLPALLCLGATVLVSSGRFAGARRRETGLLRSLGFTPSEVAVILFLEELLLAVSGGSLALILAWAWGRGLDGAGLLSAVFPEASAAGIAPPLSFPWHVVATPIALAVAIVMASSLPASVAAARGEPADLLRP